MAQHGSPGKDHGLGIEVVDESMRVAEVSIDPRRQAAVERAQQRGKSYWVVAVIALILLAEQTVFSFLLYSPILGKLAVEFHTDQVQWVYTALLLAGALTVPLLTKLGDIYGKRRMLMVGAAVTSIGCAVCAVAPTFTVVIIGRVLMAAGTAFLPLCVSMMREVFPVRTRAIAIALAVNGSGAISVLGPLFAGWLTDVWSPRAPFVFQLALCLTAGLLLLVVPDSPARLRARVDYLGAALLGVGVFGLTLGLSRAQSGGWDGLTITLVVVGLLALPAWALQLRLSKDPLINVGLLRRRATITPAIAVAFVTASTALVNLMLTLAWSTPHALAPYGRGLSAMQIAYWTMPAGVLGTLTGIFVGMTVRSVGYRTHVVVGGLASGLAALFLAFNLEAAPWLMITVVGLAGLGSMSAAAGVSLILTAVPADQRAIATGVSVSVNSLVGGTLQVLLFAVLSTSVLMVAGGVAFYTGASYTKGFIIAAVVAAVGVVAALLVPHGRRQPRPATPVGSDAAAVPGPTMPV